jgi:hypothetical protein
VVLEGCRVREERVVYTCAPVTELSGRDGKQQRDEGEAEPLGFHRNLSDSSALNESLRGCGTRGKALGPPWGL